MASATDIITYIGVPLAVLGVLPVLFNGIQCLFIRHRLSRSLPASARKLFHLHPNPVAGTVTCTFREPTLKFENFWDDLRRGHAPTKLQALPHVESRLLSASWMRLITVLGLKAEGDDHISRKVVDSSLTLDSAIMSSDWRSMIFLVLGLGVSPSDPALQRLRELSGDTSKQTTLSRALCSERGEELIQTRWREEVLYLRLTQKCSAWSMHRALSSWHHLLIENDGKREMLHLNPAAKRSNFQWRGQKMLEICDCENLLVDSGDPSIFQTIQYALTWALHFEDLKRTDKNQVVHAPQNFLFLRFQVLEELRHLSSENLQWRVSELFPGSNTQVISTISALNAIWNSAEHKAVRKAIEEKYDKVNRQRSKLRFRPLHEQLPSEIPIDFSNDVDKSVDSEKATGRKMTTTAKSTHSKGEGSVFDFYAKVHLSPVFRPLWVAHRPSAVIAPRDQSSQLDKAPVPAPTATDLNIDDETSPAGLLARLIVSLSTVWSSTMAKGWVLKAIGDKKPFYNVECDDEDNAFKILAAHDGGMVKME